MKLLTVPPRQGALWVRRGIEVFLQAPLGFCLMISAMLLALIVVNLFGMAGVALTLAAPPLVSLAFMIATQRVLRGERRPSARAFIDPWRAGPSKARSLLKLCVAYAVAFWLILTMTDQLSGGAFNRLAPTANGTIDLTVLMQDSRLFWAMALCCMLLALLSLAFWHAPALIYWGGRSMSQSLFSSVLACWRSRGAFTIYGFVWAALNLVVSWLLGLLMLVVGNGIMTPLLFSVGVMLSGMFYTSLYFSFADSFSAPDAGDADPPA